MPACSPMDFSLYLWLTDPEFETKAADVIRLVTLSAAARRGVLHRREDGDSGARSAGPGPAAVARTRRTARLRRPPTRDAVALCGAEYPDGRSRGPYRGGSSHSAGIRRLLADRRRDTAPTARDAHHRGQFLRPQNAASPDLLGGAPVRPSPLHANRFVLAQSSRTLALQDRARCHGAGNFHPPLSTCAAS